MGQKGGHKRGSGTPKMGQNGSFWGHKMGHFGVRKWVKKGVGSESGCTTIRGKKGIKGGHKMGHFETKKGS